DAEGRALNVNADTVAGKVAEALEARKLVLMTDIEGVKDDAGQVLSSIDATQTESLIDSGVISG
ncbi:MAG: acetylglutamate kinase, partial [Gammaproteobacteria bacterium]|nr:acetylglutamate kinase [Gammaproteobacteria bacterium]